MGCSRARHRADGGVCHSSVRQRTTANEPANNGPRFRAHCCLTRHTPRTTSAPRHIRGGGRGALPPRPPEIYRPCAKLGEKSRNGTHSASRLRSRPLSRRSGRVSASPCPPLRDSAFYLRSNRRTTRGARRRAKNAARPRPFPHNGEQFGRAKSASLGDMPGVEPMALRALYAILGGRFFQTRLKFPVQPHFGPNQAPHGKRPAAPSTMKPKRQRNSNGAP